MTDDRCVEIRVDVVIMVWIERLLHAREVFCLDRARKAIFRRAILVHGKSACKETGALQSNLHDD